MSDRPVAAPLRNFRLNANPKRSLKSRFRLKPLQNLQSVEHRWLADVANP